VLIAGLQLDRRHDHRYPHRQRERARGSSRCAQLRRPQLRDDADADHLAQVSFNQVNDLAGHLGHGDLDVKGLAGAVRPHPVGYQVAPGERLKQSVQQTRGYIGVQHEADGYGSGGGHDRKLRTKTRERKGGDSPAAQAAGPLIRVLIVRQCIYGD
jgi:hypothetical protein